MASPNSFHTHFCFCDSPGCSPPGQTIPAAAFVEAPITFWLQLLTGASTMNTLSIVHSHSMSLTSLRMHKRAFPGVIMDGSTTKTFLDHPYYSCGFSRSVWQPPETPDQTHHKVVICWQVCTSLHPRVQNIWWKIRELHQNLTGFLQPNPARPACTPPMTSLCCSLPIAWSTFTLTFHLRPVRTSSAPLLTAWSLESFSLNAS